MRLAVARKSEPEPQSTGQRGLDGSIEEARSLQAIAAGDASAFRVVVARHLPHLLATARRILRDDAEAEDVAQDALVRLWRSAKSLELGPGGLKPWLRRVVSNLCIDRIRAGRRVSVVDKVPEQIEAASQLRSIDERELASRVDEVIKTLPERQRLALTLFHYDGLSQIEVGTILGISDEAVESLLARARRSLKTALKNEWHALLPDSNDRQ